MNIDLNEDELNLIKDMFDCSEFFVIMIYLCSKYRVTSLWNKVTLALSTIETDKQNVGKVVKKCRV